MPFEIHSVEEPHAPIRAELGKPIRFGLSRDSDFQILGTQTLLKATTAQLWVRGNHCYVKNLTNGPDLVWIDEHSISGTESINGDCTLQVGDSRFHVRIVADDQVEEALPEEPIGFDFNIVKHNSVIQEWIPQDPRWELRDALEKLFKESRSFLVANFKLAGIAGPELGDIGDDLFEEMPVEVKSMYSLHSLHACSFADSFSSFGPLSSADAAIWVIPRMAAVDAISEGKIFLAWLARPSVLKMVLRDSSSGFCEQLMECFSGFVVADDASAAGWAILATADFDSTAAGLS